jgi:hypothetical protein
MNPTPRLRFVERDTGTYEQYDVKVTERHGTEVCYRPKKVRILQQWFAYDIDYPATKGEWKDVPTVEEKDVKTF